MKDKLINDTTITVGGTEASAPAKKVIDNVITPSSIYLGEKEMAEVDTNMLHQDHSDIRREAAQYSADIRQENAKDFADARFATASGLSDVRREQAADYAGIQLENMKGFDRVNADVIGTGSTIRAQSAAETNDIIKEGLKESFALRGDIKDTRFDLADRVGNVADRVTGQASDYFISNAASDRDSARDIATLKTLQDASIARITSEIAANAEKVATANALEAAKNAAAVMLEAAKNANANALGQATISRDIWHDGEKTRALINDLKYHDLNRALIERNSELVEERNWGRHWYHGANQAQFGQQFAQLQSQMQNFNSQLAETRQGMVNFGTMAGVGQSSTNNNVR